MGKPGVVGGKRSRRLGDHPLPRAMIAVACMMAPYLAPRVPAETCIPLLMTTDLMFAGAHGFDGAVSAFARGQELRPDPRGRSREPCSRSGENRCEACAGCSRIHRSAVADQVSTIVRQLVLLRCHDRRHDALRCWPRRHHRSRAHAGPAQLASSRELKRVARMTRGVADDRA